MIYPKLFKNKYPFLRGRDWLRYILSDDLHVFITIGLENSQHGYLGGIARARTAKRDERGQVIKNETNKI
jgi:hypothetical protein